MDTQIIVALIAGVAVIISAIITYKKDARVKILEVENDELHEDLHAKNNIIKDRNFKISVSDKLLDFAAFNQIKESVDRIFEKTKADQFLIMIAVNGKTNFRLISVIFEQHKTSKYKVNAIIRYRDVEIDDEYRALLKSVEHNGSIDLVVDDMKPQLLRDFYTIENIKHSKLRFLYREHLDENNDIVIYSSVSTHEKDSWTHLENAIIKMEYEGSVMHTIKEFI